MQAVGQRSPPSITETGNGDAVRVHIWLGFEPGIDRVQVDVDIFGPARDHLVDGAGNPGGGRAAEGVGGDHQVALLGQQVCLADNGLVQAIKLVDHDDGRVGPFARRPGYIGTDVRSACRAGDCGIGDPFQSPAIRQRIHKNGTGQKDHQGGEQHQKAKQNAF